MRPIPGSVYEVAKPFITRAGKAYDVGMRLELYEETDQAPFGYTSRISNWFVKCPYFSPPEPESVWSSIWVLIEDGYLIRVSIDSPEPSRSAAKLPYAILIKERT